MKGVPCRLFLKRKPVKINPSYYRLEYEEISFYTRGKENRVLLRGWYIPSPDSNKCIIMIHGWGGNRAHPEVKLLEVAKELIYRGYNILTFDLRGHGESGGNKVSFGAFEAYDILGAYDFAVKEKNILPSNIGLMGFSYGAYIIILAAVKEKISGAVSDSGPGDTIGFIEEFTVAKVKWCPPLFYIARYLTRILVWIAGMWFRINVRELDTAAAVKKISTPIFFIHGTKDNIPYSLVQKLYRVKKRNPLDRIWIAPSRHTEIYKDFPEEYIKRVVEFFKKAL